MSRYYRASQLTWQNIIIFQCNRSHLTHTIYTRLHYSSLITLSRLIMQHMNIYLSTLTTYITPKYYYIPVQSITSHSYNLHPPSLQQSNCTLQAYNATHEYIFIHINYIYYAKLLLYSSAISGEVVATVNQYYKQVNF